MDKNISILIYEKEKLLNSILYQQISDTGNYETYSVNDQINLIELANKKKFDICVLNIEDISPNYYLCLENLLVTNHLIDIVGYCDKLDDKSIIDKFNITQIKKPFRFISLLGKLEYIKLTKYKNSKIITIKHIEYLPYKKTLFNTISKITIHLTEKENYLLNFLYEKRDLELTKNDILTNIWGVKEVINTHTLETHVYRLKQKLFKLEPNLSFSLTNQNGLYSLKY